MEWVHDSPLAMSKGEKRNPIWGSLFEDLWKCTGLWAPGIFSSLFKFFFCLIKPSHMNETWKMTLPVTATSKNDNVLTDDL